VTVELRQAVETDLPRVEALVRATGLMTEGLRDFFPAGFVVATDGEALLGVCGVEPRGRAGLLRSVAVADAARGTGLGRRLVRLAIERSRHVDALYLLTRTVPSFFRHLGFGVLARDRAPAEVRGAPEFTSETCSTAKCMWLPIAPGVGPGLPLAPARLERDALGAALLAHQREPGEVAVTLGPREQALLAEMPWPLRRAEWLAGRRVAKALLEAAFDYAPSRTEVLPLDSGAPSVWLDGRKLEDLTLNLSHTRGYAVAAASRGAVGVDACDDIDGPRLANIASRVFSEGEAEGCGAHRTPQTQAAVWALKEAGLKLRIGGVFEPGARSITVVGLEPAAVADPSMRVTLFRLPHAAVAVARERG